MNRRLLGLGVALPFVYFGIQLAAAPFYPGYSFLTRDASTLGSDGSTAPWIFNGGALVVGMLELVTAGAFLRAFPRAQIGMVLTWATALALASAAIGSVNAFLHPLPDPKHTEGMLSLLGSGMVMLPLLLTTVLWRLGARGYALFNVLLCLVLIPILTGLVQRVGMKVGADLRRLPDAPQRHPRAAPAGRRPPGLRFDWRGCAAVARRDAHPSRRLTPRLRRRVIARRGVLPCR